jgi:competence ComEA-like helix-hairpin-helix protein
MKKLLKSYLSFTRTEKMGLIGLCSLLLVFILTRLTMHLWVHPAIDADKERKLVTAWETFKRSQPRIKNDSEVQGKNDFEDAFDENESPMPGIINLNTTDSATLVRLKGIGPATASKIIAWRNEYGPFKSIDQLSEIRHFPEATFEMLKKHLTIDEVDNSK